MDMDKKGEIQLDRTIINEEVIGEESAMRHAIRKRQWIYGLDTYLEEIRC